MVTVTSGRRLGSKRLVISYLALGMQAYVPRKSSKSSNYRSFNGSDAGSLVAVQM